MGTDKSDSIWNDPRFAQGYAKRLRDYVPDSPKDMRIIIWGCVEDTDDAKFWKSIFKSGANEYFELRIRCDEDAQGKQKLKDMINKDQLGPHQIVFIDSDFDYILQCSEVNNNKYVFQTYTYLIENHYYQSENLYSYCCEVSEFHDDTVSFNFENFLKDFSSTIYKLFFCMLCNCINISSDCRSESPSLHDETILKCFHINDIIDKIKIEYKKNLELIKNVGERNYAKKFMNELDKIIIARLKNKIEDISLCDNCINENEIKIQTALESLNIYPDTTYFHINGHILEDCVINPLLNLLIGNILIPIRRKSITKNDRQKKYSNHIQKYKPLYDIKPNVHFSKSIWLEKIIDDFEKFLNDPDNWRVWFSDKTVNQSFQRTA